MAIANQIEEIAVTLYELDRQRGLRSQRWAIGAESKREAYRARARDVLAHEGFARAKKRLEDLYWARGKAILHADRLPQPLPSKARH